MTRAKGIQIYLHAGVPEDDILRSLWIASQTKGHTQDLFRSLLLKGYRIARESGEISGALLLEADNVLSKTSSIEYSHSFQVKTARNSPKPAHDVGGKEEIDHIMSLISGASEGGKPNKTSTGNVPTRLEVPPLKQVNEITRSMDSQNKPDPVEEIKKQQEPDNKPPLKKPPAIGNIM